MQNARIHSRAFIYYKLCVKEIDIISSNAFIRTKRIRQRRTQRDEFAHVLEKNEDKRRRSRINDALLTFVPLLRLDYYYAALSLSLSPLSAFTSRGLLIRRNRQTSSRADVTADGN